MIVHALEIKIHTTLNRTCGAGFDVHTTFPPLQPLPLQPDTGIWRAWDFDNGLMYFSNAPIDNHGAKNVKNDPYKYLAPEGSPLRPCPSAEVVIGSWIGMDDGTIVVVVPLTPVLERRRR
jgi:hypothetical protein